MVSITLARKKGIEHFGGQIQHFPRLGGVTKTLFNAKISQFIQKELGKGNTHPRHSAGGKFSKYPIEGATPAIIRRALREVTVSGQTDKVFLAHNGNDLRVQC